MTRLAGDGTRVAVAMTIGSIVSVQCGAALSTTIFDSVGPFGTVLLRTAFGALLLLLFVRGDLAAMRGRPIGDVILFGVALAGVTLCFFAALDRLPLGVAVTLEFVGPLGVAVLGSRRRRDLLWVALAAAGIVLLSGGAGGEAIDGVGVALALAAGGFWGLYIIQSARVGSNHPGLGGVALAGAISTLIVAPFGIAQGGVELLAPHNLAVGLAVGFLASSVPFVLELEALRRLPRAVFGVLMSLEPAVAATIGFIALSQDLSATEVIAIGLVVCASAGALRSAGTPAPRDAEP
ncbi:MAG TPA: EamA family transporter [Solirubrobacterales bacterium]|nr:EamA family transporter [Solirubrobacterales bacterium]